MRGLMHVISRGWGMIRERGDNRDEFCDPPHMRARAIPGPPEHRMPHMRWLAEFIPMLPLPPIHLLSFIFIRFYHP